MKKYLANLTRQELIDSVVIECESEDDYPCILIKNALQKSQISNLSTDNLLFKLNAVLTVDDEPFYFHIIKSSKNDYSSRQQFGVVHNFLFNRIDEPIEDNTLYELVDSLQEYFTITPAVDTKTLQIGVFGELLTIKVLHENGYTQIVEKFHKDFFSRHDIEISNTVRIEVKTTDQETRIHNFRHEQISRSDIKVYVVSFILELAQEGLSLFDLFTKIKGLIKDPEIIFGIEKVIKRCDISELSRGVKIAEKKAVENMKIFDADILPKIDNPLPLGVSSVSYDVDCSFANNIDIKHFIALLQGV